jgi:hypothetical protein
VVDSLTTARRPHRHRWLPSAVIGLETITGALLLAGYARAGAGLAAVLLLTFSGSAWAARDRGISCRCFAGASSALGIHTVGRNAVLLAAASWVAASPEHLSWSVETAIAGVSLAAAVMVADVSGPSASSTVAGASR